MRLTSAAIFSDLHVYEGVGAAVKSVRPGDRVGCALTLRAADVNCLKLLGKPGDRYEDDFVLLADVFPAGYHATEGAHVRTGDTVVIFGAGPVGLCATSSSQASLVPAFW